MKAAERNIKIADAKRHRPRDNKPLGTGRPVAMWKGAGFIPWPGGRAACARRTAGTTKRMRSQGGDR